MSEDNPAEAVELAKKSFAPFLIGARMCAARNMAVMELLLTVAHVIWAMDFKVADGPVGRIGQGGPGMQRGRERDDEFQVYGHFVTVGKDGPVLQFGKRLGVVGVSSPFEVPESLFVIGTAAHEI